MKHSLTCPRLERRRKRRRFLRDGLRTELSIELTKRFSLRTTSMLQSVVQNPADKRLRHHRLAGVARIFRDSLDRANCQLISFQIVRASCALPAGAARTIGDQRRSIHRLEGHESSRRTRGRSIHYAARFASLSSEPFDAVVFEGCLAVTHAKSFAKHRSSVQSRATRIFFSSRGSLNK